MRIVAPFAPVVPVVVVLWCLTVVTSAFKEGPYPNVTGGFGERSCHLCHLDNPVNAPGGTLELTGVPPSYTPRQVYAITIRIERDDVRRAGFEIAARFASGKQKGRQAGSWRVLDARAQLIPGAVDKSLIFVQHNLAGSRAPSRGANAWTLEWTAPDRIAGPILFNVAANASNNDDSPLGDYIYLKSVRSSPAK